MAETYRAISVYQPWATLIALDVKQFETRSWSTPYRGPIAIHAARRTPEVVEMALPFLALAGYYDNLGDGWFAVEPLPTGAVLCIVRLVDVLPTERVVKEAFARRITAQELALGNFSPGRYAWQLELVEVFPTPLPASGKQGFWTWTRNKETPHA